MKLTRIGKFGQTYSLESICGEPNKTKITYKEKSIIVDYSLQEISQRLYLWQQAGQVIQVAFSNLSDSEREFILTGITPEKWNEIFSEEEE